MFAFLLNWKHFPGAPEIANVPSSTDGWTFSSQYDAAIPLEYRPYARESRVFVVYVAFD